MVEAFILGVPTADQIELERLLEELGAGADLVEQRYFDGAAFIEGVIPVVAVSAAAWHTLRTWITARAEVKKATRVTVNGLEITAMGPKDVERILATLSAHVKAIDGDE